jgi:hypothetical protein
MARAINVRCASFDCWQAPCTHATAGAAQRAQAPRRGRDRRRRSAPIRARAGVEQIVINIQDKLHGLSAGDRVPVKSNVGLIAGLVMATGGFIAILVYYL